jgi:hypothetical protein
MYFKFFLNILKKGQTISERESRKPFSERESRKPSRQKPNNGKSLCGAGPEAFLENKKSLGTGSF